MTLTQPLAMQEAEPVLTPIRPLMLTAQFLPEVFGGAEQQCLRLSQALAELGHQPVILTSRSAPETPAEEVIGTVPVIRLRTPAPPQLGGRHIASTVLWMRAVARWLRAHRDRFDLIHCHQAKINAWAGVRAGHALGRPCVVKPGSAGPNFDLAGLARRRGFYGAVAARQIASKADRFIAISAEMSANLAAAGIDRRQAVFIPNGIALPAPRDRARATAADALRRRIGLPDDRPVLLFSGRLEAQKNASTLLRALSLLSAPVSLVLLGDGTLRPTLEREAAALGLARHCHFAGRVDNVAPYLDMADIFALPARAEGLSNALIEAMAAGITPVGSAVSGNTDLIRPGETGFLYGPPDDPVALARALEAALAAGPAGRARIGEAARHLIARDHDIRRIAARHVAIYRAVLDERGAG